MIATEPPNKKKPSSRSSTRSDAKKVVQPHKDSKDLETKVITRILSRQEIQSRFLTCAVANMSLVVRKPVFGVSDQVRHKLGCTATEDG